MFTKQITNTLAALLGVAVIGVVTANAARAQTGPCGPHADVVSWLESRYQERQAGFGLIKGRAVMELFTSRNGTWTLITTDRMKRTCLVAAGNSWVDVDPPDVQAQLTP